MKEISERFSFIDFLAYLFPGTLLWLVILSLFLTVSGHSAAEVVEMTKGFNFSWFILYIVVAYVLGSICSSAMANLDSRVIHFFEGKQDPRSQVPFKHMEKIILEKIKKFCPEIGDDKITESHFYLARSIVKEHAPRCASAADRQNSLRQLRRNCLLPFLLLFFEGIVILGCALYPFNTLKLAIGALVLAVSFLCIKVQVRAGLVENRKSESREIYTGLIVAAAKLDRES